MFLIFDTETSGLPNKFLAPNDANQARVVQLAAVLLDSTFREIASLHCLLKPTTWHVSKEAESVHGITTAYAKSYGVSSEVAIKMFAEFSSLASKHIAHNLIFDKKVLDIEFANHKVSHVWHDHKMFCTMLNTTQLCKLPQKNRAGFKWPKLSEAYKHFFGEDLVDSHDAMVDVRATARIFKHLVQNQLVII